MIYLDIPSCTFKHRQRIVITDEARRGRQFAAEANQRGSGRAPHVVHFRSRTPEVPAQTADHPLLFQVKWDTALEHIVKSFGNVCIKLEIAGPLTCFEKDLVFLHVRCLLRSANAHRLKQAGGETESHDSPRSREHLVWSICCNKRTLLPGPARIPRHSSKIPDG